MARVELGRNAHCDLLEIKRYDPRAYAKIVAILKQMQSDPELQERMLDAKADVFSISIMRWVAQYRKGRNLYRLKKRTVKGDRLHPYRIIYAYAPPGTVSPDPEFHILAVVHRARFDYEDENDEDNEYTRRILADYADL